MTFTKEYRLLYFTEHLTESPFELSILWAGFVYSKLQEATKECHVKQWLNNDKDMQPIAIEFYLESNT